MDAGETQPAERAAAAYERSLAEDRTARQARGAFYTPPELVGWILDRALSAGTRRVLDPACGTGHFLVAAAERIGAAHVFGSDLDADAVAHARARLHALDPSVPAEVLEHNVRVADGLAAWEGERFDAVVGNPPFLGQLRRRTSGQTGGLGAYTDTSAAFLHAALSLAADGGTVALVQPLSVLAARDAGPVRAEVAARGAVVDFWCSAEPVFEGTAVRTCVPVVLIGEAPPTDPDAWGLLAAPHLGIPAARLATSGRTVGDIATCTADFRDQYYGLVPHVREHPAGRPPAAHAPLVTSGLIDPAELRWGRFPTRFARTVYDAPSVDLASLRADGALAAWADARLVPKLLVAAQGRVIEAVVDEAGVLLPSVPVLTVVPHEPADVWRLLALTLAPPLVAHAAGRFVGTGLTPGSVKVSARQFAALALPADDRAWAEAAVLAQRAQQAGAEDRPGLLVAAARVMAAAYGAAEDDPSMAWWVERLSRRAPGGGATRRALRA